jgi:hypothetical protein
LGDERDARPRKRDAHPFEGDARPRRRKKHPFARGCIPLKGTRISLRGMGTSRRKGCTSPRKGRTSPPKGTHVPTGANISGGVARQASLWPCPPAKAGARSWPALRAIACGDAISALSRSVNHRLISGKPPACPGETAAFVTRSPRRSRREGASQKLDKQDAVARASRACSGSSAGVSPAFRE